MKNTSLGKLIDFKLFALAGFVLAATLPLRADSCSSVAGNLVTNCGFETGDTSGWTTGGNFGATGVAASFDGYLPNSGTYFLFMGPVGSDGTISQTLSTSAGMSYTLAFYYASNGTDPSDFSAWWDGSELLSLTDPNSGSAYNLYTYTVTGSGSDTLQFDFRDDPAYDALDDVSVSLSTSATPEPASITLLLTGLGAVVAARRRRA